MEWNWCSDKCVIIFCFLVSTDTDCFAFEIDAKICKCMNQRRLNRTNERTNNEQIKWLYSTKCGHMHDEFQTDVYRTRCNLFLYISIYDSTLWAFVRLSISRRMQSFDGVKMKFRSGYAYMFDEMNIMSNGICMEIWWEHWSWRLVLPQPHHIAYD